MNRRIRLLAAVLWCASTASAVDWTALKPQGAVSDFAGVVDAGTKHQLEVWCAAVEQATGAHLALVTLSSLQGEPVADVTHALFRAWFPDPQTAQHAALWVVAVQNSRDWLEAGSGLSGVINNDQMAEWLNQARPLMARNDFGRALTVVADGMGRSIAAAQHKSIAAHLPRYAGPGFVEPMPWLLAVGAVLLGVGLWRVLGRPARRIRAPGGFGGDAPGGW